MDKNKRGKPQFSGNGTNIALGELCEILNGYAFKSKRYVDEGIRVIRIANVQKGYLEDSHPCFYPATEKGSIAQFLLYENDLLLSLTGNVGRVALLDNKFLPAALNQRVACLRIKDESLLNKRYLFHCLNSMCFENRCIESANGIAQKNLSTVWLRGYAIPVPQMDKQLEIARRFDLIQAQISRAKAQIAKLDSLVKSRFIEMFENEKQIVRLCDVCDTFNGDRGSNYPSADERLNAGIPFINAGNLVGGTVSFNDMEYISEEKYLQLSGGKIQSGDLLYCLRGSLGKNALTSLNRGAIASSLMIIRCKQGIIKPQYLYMVMNSPSIKRQVANANNGSSQPNLSAGSVKQFSIPLPPLFHQQEFSAFFSQVDKLRFKTQQQIEKLEMLKESLMQEYFG